MVYLVLTGPKISYGFVLEKFQKGNFLGHPVLVVYIIKALFGRIKNTMNVHNMLEKIQVRKHRTFWARRLPWGQGRLQRRKKVFVLTMKVD